jgi:hypothetical protein
MTAEVYKWRYGFGRTERLNFIKRVMAILSFHELQ